MQGKWQNTDNQLSYMKLCITKNKCLIQLFHICVWAARQRSTEEFKHSQCNIEVHENISPWLSCTDECTADGCFSALSNNRMEKLSEFQRILEKGENRIPFLKILRQTVALQHLYDWEWMGQLWYLTFVLRYCHFGSHHKTTCCLNYWKYFDYICLLNFRVSVSYIATV